MLFNSYVFLYAFLPITLTGYGLLTRAGRVPAALWLVAASFVFYGWWNPSFVPLLAGSIGANYAISRLIDGAGKHPRRQHWIVVGGVAANIATLGYYKYLDWTISLLNATGLLQLPAPHITMPLGISFFTFTQIGYLIDCKQGVAKQRGLLNYLLFVTFFPHLIAGPILHNREMMPQFANPRTYRIVPDAIAVGLGIFTLGLLKKCLIADPMGALVPEGFAHPETLSLFGAWQVVLSYSLQLYFDFSGYSDMAIGLARMFNLKLPMNFNSPYKAASIIDYWQRWHITLTRFIMMYIYSPVALWVTRTRASRGLDISRRATASPGGFASMVLLPIVITMGLAGIWHGAGAQFVAFGLLHAVYLTVNHAWRIVRPHHPHGAAPPIAAHVGSVALTYLCVLVGAVFFRAPSVRMALEMLASMIGTHGIGAAFPLPSHFDSLLGHTGALLQSHGIVRAAHWQDTWHLVQTLGGLVGVYGIVWFMPNTQQIFAAQAPVLEAIKPVKPVLLQWQNSLPWAIAFGLATTLGLLSVGGTGEFLYFQF